MDIRFVRKLGEGGFGDVWEATDALDRRVAVKIIRSSAAMLSSALDHARALGRLRHPNVVSVYSIETVTDPETGHSADAVVMELLEGETLAVRLRRLRFTQAEVFSIGNGLIEGLEHIHTQGLAHGDLHVENIILAQERPKIIDVLYRDSLALLSNATKEIRLRKDILSLRMMLYDVILSSELDPADAAEFNSALAHQPTLADVKRAFAAVLDPARRSNDQLRLEQSIQRVRDDAYVEGDLYATALAAETPVGITTSLLEKLTDDRGLGARHRPYLRLLWDRLTVPQKRQVAGTLSEALDRHIPNGRWGSPLQMLAAFGKEGWDHLPAVVRLRLEGAIVNDILAGHIDIYGANIGRPGKLGTYAQIFWPHFRDVDRLTDNLVARLNSGWYGQNYVGEYFLWMLPNIGDTSGRRSKLVEAVASAVKNDAKVVIRELTRLPRDWQDEIAEQSRSQIPTTSEPLVDDDIPF